MGAKQSDYKYNADWVTESTAAQKLGRVHVSGRYHGANRNIKDDYVLTSKKLGCGYNGVVMLARSKATDTKFAVKPFKLRGISADKRRELQNETVMFLSMDHPHVATLVDVYEQKDQLLMVMEFLEGGELLDRIHTDKSFTEDIAANLTSQMLLAINYLHGTKIVHRDIKCENFMFDSVCQDHLKLIDFGFSRYWNGNRKMQLTCGTLPYCSPEVIDKHYTDKCDLWSLGVVVFMLLMGHVPFSGKSAKMVSAIKQGRFEMKADRWSKLSSQAQDFIMRLLKINPDERLSASEALSHQWIKSNGGRNGSALDCDVIDSLCQFQNASRFRRVCMSMMAWSLSPEQVSRVRAMFLELDHDKSGYVTIYELRTALERTVSTQDVDVQNVFAALDVNHNEKIDYSEFLSAMTCASISVNENLLSDAFRRFDKSRSGFITTADLRTVLGECCGSQEEVESLVEEADVSQDGRISLEEFVQYLKGDAEDHHQDAAIRCVELQRRRIASKSSCSQSRACVLL